MIDYSEFNDEVIYGSSVGEIADRLAEVIAVGDGFVDRNGEALARLRDLIGEALARPKARVYHKRRANGKLYADVQYTGDRGQVTKYLGRVVDDWPAPVEPRPYMFRVTPRQEKKLEREGVSVWGHRLTDGDFMALYKIDLDEAWANTPREIKYNRLAYVTAMQQYADDLEVYEAAEARRACIDRLAGLRRLQALTEAGFEIVYPTS